MRMPNKREKINYREILKMDRKGGGGGRGEGRGEGLRNGVPCTEDVLDTVDRPAARRMKMHVIRKQLILIY